MKKVIFIIVMCLLTAGAIVFGTLCFVGENFGEALHFPKWLVSVNTVIGDTKVVSEEKELEDFTSIVVDADIADIEIEYGEEFKYKYKCTDVLVPTITVEDKVLKVKQNKKTNRIVGNTKSQIVITVKKDVQLEDCDLTVDVGNLEISEVAMKHLEMDCAVGNIEVRNSKIDKVDAKADVGNVQISLADGIQGYSIDLQVDVGEMSCDGDRKRGQNYHYSVDDESSKYIKVSADCGNINVK